MNTKTDKTGTKGTMGTGGLDIARAREDSLSPGPSPVGRGELTGIDFDNDLSMFPDGETVAEGSDPVNPLPTFCQTPGCWPQMIQSIVDKGQTPAQRDILLLGALNVIGSTLGPKVRTMYGGRWLSPTMMLFVVAPPASGKGSMMPLKQIVQPLHDELLEQWRREMADYKAKKMKFDYMGKERANLPKEEIPVAPVRRFFIIPANNSGTGMQANIINSGGRGIIFEPEADTLSSSLHADYGHFDDALRKTFDHEGISFYRRTEDESKEVGRTYLSVLQSGTPAQVARLIPTSENGLFSRFMFYYMPPVRQWMSQFEVQEDLTEWFRTLGREWKGRLDGMKCISHFTFSLSDDQQMIFNAIMGDIFDRAQHTMGDEAVSIVIRLAHHILRIMSVVALLRSLSPDPSPVGRGVVCSELMRPAADIPAENLADGICQRYEYGIAMDDFTPCLMMAGVLFRHSMHILSLLPAVEVTNRGTADKEALFSLMHDTFTRKEYLDKAGEMGISENTALQWIKRGMKKGQILKVGRGEYQFATAG